MPSRHCHGCPKSKIFCTGKQLVSNLPSELSLRFRAKIRALGLGIMLYCSNVGRSAARLMGRRHGLVETLKCRIELATFGGESQRLHPLDAHLGNIGLRFQNLHHLCYIGLFII